MFLVVGLGNPGQRYAATRHNVGFLVVDGLASAASSWQERFKGQFALSSLDGHRVGLLKPQTFMNLSGQSVRPAVDFYKVALSDVLVVHDELDLPFGQVKLKLGGGEAGHNGLRSVSEQLGSREYYRLRLGVGRPPREFPGSPADFVLQAFAPDEQSGVEGLVNRGVSAAQSFIQNGPQAAMNEVNRKP